MPNDAAQNEPTCQICGCSEPCGLHRGVFIRPALVDLIREQTDKWDADGWICTRDLDAFRHKYVLKMLKEEKGELGPLDMEVIESIWQKDLLSRNPDDEDETHLTFGERMADRLADLAGSWGFILIFAGILLLWILVNTVALLRQPFDPYPYILLNLILSCLAAIQAPIIMMSQGRQEDRDRAHARRDYQINLKAELEIRYLHEKMDHLLSNQWERLLEIQDTQAELLNELRQKK